MNNTDLKGKMINATKWSSITEIASKLVIPITNLLLARILVPEAFGVVAMVSMIISFADMFTDAGFQKYLVQHEFKDEKTKYKHTTVAFWTNLVMSLIIWGFISLFCETLASVVGNPGLGKVIAISCIQLPLTSFSSIQMALFKRDFNFKTLFHVRMVSVILPFVITIPLATVGLSYWALIIGTLCGQLSNSIILTVKSQWKPTFFYSFKILKEMLSFSLWSLVEGISIWLSTWVDILIIGSILSPYSVGLYKISLNMVNSLMMIITASITPILFSSLSRLQKDEKSFNNVYFKFQKIAAYFLFPLGLGLYFYSDFATQVMLGNQWTEAGFIIGFWGLTSAIKIVLSDFNSVCYRAKGMPKLSFLLQIVHLIFLIPTCIISLRFGFETLVYARALIRFQLVITSLLAMQFILHISIKKIVEGLLKPAVLTIIMGLAAICFRYLYNNTIWNLVSIFLCIIIYTFLISIFGKEDFGIILEKINSKRKGNKVKSFSIK
ncbi:PST family polysaccharide transporter [Peribacillus deserti]|uniref:PST family polysaccharide transporter n=1 Tax=Peribacillus deserti TaxID=673318 RepID=A0ABS2QC89_9BACI|nr:lipopolysaccharide biosynthesis protein [Peribacillus deserti]MBM7690782.1 PST family polysaccharide transporter [Peribacillus deserti]